MSTVSLRPRSGVELIDASFQFLRENFTLLFTAAAAAFIPVAIVAWVAAMSQGDMLLAFLSGLVNWVFNTLAFAACVVIVAKRYLGEDISPADALRTAGSRIGTLLAISFIYGLMIVVGTILFIVPGIYFAAKYFAAAPVAMVEGLGQQRSFERSASLTDGSKLRVVGVYGLAYIVYVVITMFVSAMLTLIFGAAIGALVTTLLMACIYPFIAVVGTLLYFDLRIRREGLDLDLMLDPTAGTVAAAG